MISASAPGQVFLFGEHAVVYGQPALAVAIGRRVNVEVRPRKDHVVTIASRGVGRLLADLSRSPNGWRIVPRRGDAGKLVHATKSIELVLNKIDRAGGLDISIRSEIPMGSGLASSSAVSVATAAATARALEAELSLEDVLEIAFRAELVARGVASRTGAAVATYGGFIKVSGGSVERLRGMPEPQVVIGYTGVRGNTAKLVRWVKQLKESHPATIELILKAIGDVAGAGIEALEQRDLERVGSLMDVNQALLAALGVSSKELEKLIRAARAAGALGAKLTGAGGGGCMIALVPRKGAAVARALRAAKGRPIQASIGVNGLMVARGSKVASD